MTTQRGTPGSRMLLITAGAQAAAQGPVRRALPTQLLPFAGVVAFSLRLSGRKTGTETRPDAGNHNPRRMEVTP